MRLVVRDSGQGQDAADGGDLPARIVIPPRDTEVARGAPVTELHCIANARSLYHLETLWFKDDTPIESSGVGHTFNDLWNRTLSLLNADPSHAGRYSCQVSTKSARSAPTVTAVANVTILGNLNLFTRGLTAQFIIISVYVTLQKNRFSLRRLDSKRWETLDASHRYRVKPAVCPLPP